MFFNTKSTKRLRELNDRIAVIGTKSFGTMTAFYICVVYSLLAVLPSVAPYQSVLLFWSNAVQLAALPLLMVGNIVLSKEAERRSQEDHEMLIQEMAQIKEMNIAIHTFMTETHRVLLHVAANANLPQALSDAEYEGELTIIENENANPCWNCEDK